MLLPCLGFLRSVAKNSRNGLTYGYGFIRLKSWKFSNSQSTCVSHGLCQCRLYHIPRIAEFYIVATPLDQPVLHKNGGRCGMKIPRIRSALL
jgi:hypothetical protein